MYKVTNKTRHSRKFREHKTAKAYFLRSGESVTINYPPVVANPSIFEVKEIKSEEESEKFEEFEKFKKKSKKTKLGGKK